MPSKTIETNEEFLANFAAESLLYLTCAGGIDSRQYKNPLLFSRLMFGVNDSETRQQYSNFKPKKWEGAGFFGGEIVGEKYTVASAESVGVMAKMRMKSMNPRVDLAAPTANVKWSRLMVNGEAKNGYATFQFCDRTETWVEVAGTARKISTGRTKGGREELTVLESYLPSICRYVSYLSTKTWKVVLSQPGTPGVSFMTDPLGVKGFFQCRDKPEGRNRRAALLHWVREHYRKNRHDHEAEILVREHMRGATIFSWFDLQGTVIPPDAEVI